MKAIVSYFALLLSLFSPVANAQFLRSTDNGLFDSGSNWFVGKGDFGIYADYDLSNMASELGCYPTGDQVPRDPLRLSANQNYSNFNNFSGSLAPGEKLIIKVSTCNAGGDQPFIQSTVLYELINRKVALTGYVVDPKGKIYPMGHGISTQPQKVIVGGVADGHGMPGTWTFVLSNPTRYHLRVYDANFRIYLR